MKSAIAAGLLWTALLTAGVVATIAQEPLPAANDDQQLRRIEQELARAWSNHDRSYIEAVLAPEWSVTQTDGQIISRAEVLGTFFNAVSFDSNVIDDLSVMVFDNTAIVRGRTTASGTFNGAPVSARLRFTDVFIRRNRRWQVVASHASTLAAP